MSAPSTHKDKPEEAENIKRLERFAIEVWNLTQNWIAVNDKAKNILGALINERLQLMYARQTTSEDEGLEKEDGNVKTYLNPMEKSKIQAKITLDAERIVELVDKLEKIVSKFGLALGRISSWRQLCPNPGPSIAHILNTMEVRLPAVIEMYKREVQTRRKALLDLATYENRDLFTAVSLTFTYQPFVDEDLVGCLYSLVANQKLFSIAVKRV